MPRKLEPPGGPAAHDHPAADVAHAHEPLVGEIGLDGGLGAVAVADLDLAVLDLSHELVLLEILHHVLAGFEAVLAGVGSGVVVQAAVVVENVDDVDLVLVPGPHVVVVVVVRRGDLHRAGAQRGA